MALPAPPISSSDSSAKLSDAQKAAITEYMSELKKHADYAAWKWMSARVPSSMQEEFLAANPEPVDPDAPVLAH